MTRQIKRQSLLYRSKVEYADFSINHALGCAHGCKYPCYAMQMAKRFGRIKDYKDWTKPKLVSDAPAMLAKELGKVKEEIGYVHLCFTTDPFMYGYGEMGQATLEILRKLNENKIPASVLTKGVFPSDLALTSSYNPDNLYGVTLVSLDERFRERFEPNAAPLRERLAGLIRLHEKGLHTWVSIEPYPTPDMVKQDILPILKKISFVEKIVFGKLNYSKSRQKNGDTREFYAQKANEVIKFCLDHGIHFHIKEGTHGGAIMSAYINKR